MAGPVDLKDFVDGFLLEAEEHLHSVNQNLVAASAAAQKGQAEPRAVRELFRSLHTIKGLAAMVGAGPVVDVSHEMEGLLRTADRAGGRISEATLDLLVQGSRALEERVRVIGAKGVSGIPPVPRALLEALAQAQGNAAPEAASPDIALALPADVKKLLSASDLEEALQAARTGRRVMLVEFKPSPERAERGLNITSVRERLGKLGNLVKVVPRSSAASPTGISFCLLLVTDASDEALADAAGDGVIPQTVVARAAPSPEAATGDLRHPEAPAEPAEWLPADQSSIRVDVRRLDDSLEQLSSLFVTRFKLDRVASEMAAAGTDVRELKAVIAENTRQLRRLRKAISEARMVPLTELLQRLPLVVRGITKGTDKAVNVTIQAGSAEVDKAVADKIFPAVIHLVRNAVDHALETRAERGRLGKPEVGELSIICDDSSGTSLVLKVTDDGRGVDRGAVAAKLGRAPAADDEQLLEQISTAGLSTSRELTHTSGRGMGMDIVKRTVEVLGGALSLSTMAGKGTTMSLRVPVTVTIVDVFSFLAGGQTFVAPVTVVDEIVEIDAALAVTLPGGSEPGAARPRLFQHRGKTIPLFSLEGVLRRGDTFAMPRKAMVVNQGRGAVAFGVDRMLGQQEAVVRPLDDALVRVAGMAGATDLGDGRPTLVLDLASMGIAVLRSGELSV